MRQILLNRRQASGGVTRESATDLHAAGIQLCCDHVVIQTRFCPVNS